MISRYSSPVMSTLWSDPYKLDLWCEIEQHLLNHHAIDWSVPRVSVIDVEVMELTTKHDVAAFVSVLRGMAPPSVEPWIHVGLTSSDLVDTADGVRMREANQLINAAARRLYTVLDEMIKLRGSYPIVGRTHGRYAEPMTLGHALRGWQLQAYRTARQTYQQSFYGKISGATGQNLTIDEEAERFILRRLGLHRARAASQIVPRWLYSGWYYALAELAGTCLEIANWVRLSSIEGIDEAHERQTPGQVGSTAMPHKHSNPIEAERIVGLSRHARRLAHELADAGHELWWQRDLTHSALERLDLPDLCALAEFLPNRTADLLVGLELDGSTMAARADYVPSSVSAYRALLATKEDDDVDQSGDLPVDRAESSNGQPSPVGAPAPGTGHDDQDPARVGLVDQ